MAFEHSPLKLSYLMGRFQAFRRREIVDPVSGRMLGGYYTIEEYDGVEVQPVAIVEVRGNRVVDIDVDGALSDILVEALEDAIRGSSTTEPRSG